MIPWLLSAGLALVCAFLWGMVCYWRTEAEDERRRAMRFRQRWLEALEDDAPVRLDWSGEFSRN